MIAAVLLALAPAPQDLGTTTTLTLPPLAEPEKARLIDVDGDGLRDLLIAMSRLEGEQRHRYVRIHLRREKGATFATEPDYELRLTRDVTAMAVADLHSDPGAEVMLCNAQGTFVWRPLAEEGPSRVTRIADLDFLWQIGDNVDVVTGRRGFAT